MNSFDIAGVSVSLAFFFILHCLFFGQSIYLVRNEFCCMYSSGLKNVYTSLCPNCYCSSDNFTSMVMWIAVIELPHLCDVPKTVLTGFAF